MDHPKEGKVYKKMDPWNCVENKFDKKAQLQSRQSLRNGLLKEILWDTQSLVLAIAACLNIAFSPKLILVIIKFLNLNQSEND